MKTATFEEFSAWVNAQPDDRRVYMGNPNPFVKNGNQPCVFSQFWLEKGLKFSSVEDDGTAIIGLNFEVGKITGNLNISKFSHKFWCALTFGEIKEFFPCAQ